MPFHHLAHASIEKWNVSENVARYKADYEVLTKSHSGKVYVAYIIDQGDIFIKKRCKCVPRHKCKSENTIELSK